MARFSCTGTVTLAFHVVVVLTMAGCAHAPAPPSGHQAASNPAERPMVAPEMPPPSSEFNLGVAKPLVAPDQPHFNALPIPKAPAPLVTMAPLPAPPPPSVTAEAPLPEPALPEVYGGPMLRPAEPAHNTLPPPAVAAFPPPSQAPDVQPSGQTKLVRSYQIIFSAYASDMPDSAPDLLKQIAGVMSRTLSLRLKLRSFASGSPDDPVAARKLSLQRALKVREFLVAQGIASTRVDVLPLGLGLTTAEPGPADRIDIIPAN